MDLADQGSELRPGQQMFLFGLQAGLRHEFSTDALGVSLLTRKPTSEPMVHRLFSVTLLWTLALLLLGSIVHATGSSLACPDWPTCFGTMTPEMTGGVFWEHLHRLWAGALVILFTATVVVIRRQASPSPSLFRAGLAGVLLLLLQSVLGGITVYYRLPDAVSTAHLSLAFLFLALVTILTVVTGPSWRTRDPQIDRSVSWQAGVWISGLVFLQSILGALVRHKDAGVACPDVPLCLGRIIPPLDHPLVQLHFGHRALGVTTGIVVLWMAVRVVTRSNESLPRALALVLGALVLAQVVLGFVSVAVQLHPATVSTHTLLAASLLATAVALATYGLNPKGKADE